MLAQIQMRAIESQRVPLGYLSDNNTPKSILLSGVQRVLVKPKSAEKLQKNIIHTKGNFMKPTEASKQVATPVAHPTPTRNTTSAATIITPNSVNNKNSNNVINSKHSQSYHTQSCSAKVVQLSSNKENHLGLGNNDDEARLHHINYYGTPNRPSINNRSNRPTSTPPSSKKRSTALHNAKVDSTSKANHTPIRSLHDEVPESSSSHLLYSPLSNKIQDTTSVNIVRSVSTPKPRPSMLCFPFMQTNSILIEKSNQIHDYTKITPPSPSTYNHGQHHVEPNNTNKASIPVPIQQPNTSTVPHKSKVRIHKGSCIPAPTADVLSANKAAKLAALSNHSNNVPHIVGVSSVNITSPPLARYAQATHASSAATAKNTESIGVHMKSHLTLHKKPPRPNSKIPVPIVGNNSNNVETNVENIQPPNIKQVVTKKNPRITQKKNETPLVKDLKQNIIQAPEISQPKSVQLDNSGLNENSILNILNLSNYLPRSNDSHPKIPTKEIRTSYSFGSEISGVFFDTSRAEEQTFSLVESIEFSNSQILVDASASIQACMVSHATNTMQLNNKADVIVDENEENQCIFLEENLANLSIVEGPTTFSPCNISLLSNFSQATFGTEYYECPGNSFTPIHLLESVPIKEEKLDINKKSRQYNSQVAMITNSQLDAPIPTYKPKIKSIPKLNETSPNTENKLSIETNIPVIRSDSASSQLSEVSYIFPITRQNSTKSSWTEEYSAFFPPDEMEGNENGTAMIVSRELSKEAIFVSSPLPEQYLQYHGVRPKVFCSSIATDEAACSTLNKAMIMSSTVNSVSESTAQFLNFNINNSMAEEEANNNSIRHSIDFSLASCSTLNKAMILSYDQDDLTSFINKIENTTSNENNPQLAVKLSSESAVIEQVVRNARLSPPSPPWMLQSLESLPPPPPPPMEHLPSNTFNDSISILELIPTPNDLVRQFSSPIENLEDLENYDEVFSDYETIEVECEITNEQEKYDDYEDNLEYDEIDKENIDPQPFLSAYIVSQKRTTPGNSPLRSITSAININESQEAISIVEDDWKINDADIVDTSVIDKVQKYLLDESHKKFSTALQSISVSNQIKLAPQLVVALYSSFENDAFNSLSSSTSLFNNKLMLSSPSRRKESMDTSVMSLNDSQQQASFTSSMEELQSHNPKSKSEFWVQNHYSNSYSIAANKYEPITASTCSDDISKSISPKSPSQSIRYNQHQNLLEHNSKPIKHPKLFIREDCFDEQIQQQQQQHKLCPDPLASQLLNMIDGTILGTTDGRYHNSSSSDMHQNEILSSHIVHSMQHMFLPVNEKEL